MYIYEPLPFTMAGATYDLKNAGAGSTACILTPTFPVEIVAFGGIVTTAILSATNGIKLGLDLRITAGSDVGKVTGGLGTLTLTAAQCAAGLIPAGSVIKSKPGDLQAAFPMASPGPVEADYAVLPGQQAIVTCVTAADSTGVIIPFIEFRFLPKKSSWTEVLVYA